MNLKLFLLLFVSLSSTIIPRNLFGCGGDYYDINTFYTTFFNKYISDKGLYKNYYLSYNTLYTSEPAIPTEDLIVLEWAKQTGVTDTAAIASFIMRSNAQDVEATYAALKSNNVNIVPQQFQNNPFVQYLFSKNDVPTLQYLVYAKNIEPLAAASNDYWEPVQRNTAAIDSMILIGEQLLNNSKNKNLQQRYAYQLAKLNFYGSYNDDALKIYQTYFKPETDTTFVADLASSIAAGVLFKQNKKTEALYEFSKLFAKNHIKNVENYISFQWAHYDSIPIEKYMALGKTNSEKANIMVCYQLSKTQTDLNALKQIYELDNQNKFLTLLVGREINKMELSKQERLDYYYTYTGYDPSNIKSSYYAKISKGAYDSLSTTLECLYNLALPKHKSFYGISRAYIAAMNQNMPDAKKWLDEMKGKTMTNAEQDQYELTQLLYKTNTTTTLNDITENALLPSIQWLRKKADHEPKMSWEADADSYKWRTFYGQYFIKVLMPKYQAQKNKLEVFFCLAQNDNILSADYQYSAARTYLRTYLSPDDLLTLYEAYDKVIPSAYDNYLINSMAMISKPDIADAIGNNFLRNQFYDKAIDWYSKGGKEGKDRNIINAFRDDITDVVNLTESEEKNRKYTVTSKVDFAKQMKQYLDRILTNPKDSTALYQFALGLYNTTYYGPAWNITADYRSSSDGYYIPKYATEPYLKDYYACYKAENYFKKALYAFTNIEKKARIQFMIARCSQKQVPAPSYSSMYDKYGSDWSYETYEKLQKGYYRIIINNKDFLPLVTNYSNTRFYKKAYNTCSYLRDFVDKHPQKK